MLHTLNKNYTPIQELRDNGYGLADFKVAKSAVEFRPVLKPHQFEGEDDYYLRFPQKEVYWRTDTFEPIAIHGKRYKPIQYPDMLDKVRDMIERCNLDATDIQEKISVSPNGGMCFVEYILPAEEYATPDGDTGFIKIMALSSFNGVWSLIVSLGFHLSACMNSEIFIKNPAAIYKSRHTNKLDIDKAVSMLGKAADIVVDEIEFWHDLQNTSVDRVERLKIFAECAGLPKDISVEYTGIFDLRSIKNKTFNYLDKVHNETYAPRMGKNMWAVYNSITDWSTHAPSSSKNKIALMQRRTDKASEVMNQFLLAA